MQGSESEKIFDSYNLNPQLFVNEVIDSVNTIVNEAFEFFLQETAKNLQVEGTDRFEPLKKGVEYIRNIVQSKLDKRQYMWEKYCLSQCFAVPQGFSLPQADKPSVDTSSDQDAELDAQLDSLRSKLAQVVEESTDLNKELQALEMQSSKNKRSAASLNEVIQFCDELGFHEKFSELVTTASELRSSLEKRVTQMSTEIEHERAEKIRKLDDDDDKLRLNYHGYGDHSGLCNVKLEDLTQFLDDVKTPNDL
ncbi:unnamed protein product [Cuscuta epithymum]|uniref:Uncharacterized protein n=1 Tax=Cuscuta epithymum TaxID=186058 RepID=A0AAV0C2L6_9ASTE|nr:unnamed protein product [Cuscuta epithymum]CAH9142645.1 unnamed protein product [Cuscuta epithymum]